MTSELSPIEIAKQLPHSGGANFDRLLNEHLEYGYVVSRPTMFAMARAVDLNGIHTWFITSAVGNLLELLSALPFPLPQIAFCRKSDPRIRVYSLSKLASKVRKKK